MSAPIKRRASARNVPGAVVTVARRDGTTKDAVLGRLVGLRADLRARRLVRRVFASRDGE